VSSAVSAEEACGWIWAHSDHLDHLSLTSSISLHLLFPHKVIFTSSRDWMWMCAFFIVVVFGTLFSLLHRA
jgi:hypothetical protein